MVAPIFLFAAICQLLRFMRAMDRRALWTFRLFALKGDTEGHSDGNSNREPDAHVSGDDTEDSAQRGSQGYS
jgi:hypothetical protein